ncbi:MAG: cyclic nucleotide-binding domain-containing protein [Treponema sp.]|nr:cyclic nucleotide-binding domain-containing protein [Treponema sp.]
MEDQLQLNFVRYLKDSYIVVEGKNADRFFIIQQGKVRVSKEVTVVEDEGTVLGPGDFFGVISTMSAHSHIETTQALTDVVLIAVLKEQYGALIQKNTQVAMKIIMQFSKRLRHLNEALTGITLNKTAEFGPTHLAEIAAYYSRQKQYDKALYAYTNYLKYCPDGQYAGVAKERVAKLNTLSIEAPRQFGPNDTNRTYKKDTMLFSEGEPGDELFIIQKGSVKITKIVSDNEVLLAVLKAGDIFGEMALLEGKPRAATAVAYDECEVMVVNRANFEQMIKTQPQLIAKVTTLLADRIWLIYKQLQNTLINNPLGRMYDALHIQLEKNRVHLDSQSAYTFSFGQKELIHMVGLPEKDANQLLRKMLENKKIQIINEKLHTVSVEEVVRQTEYFRKMDRIEKSRKESRN